MASEAIARRYAKAYFELAREGRLIDQRGDDLRLAAETLSNPEVEEALRNPRLAMADRVRLALELMDGVGDPARNLVRLLIEHNRIDALDDVCRQYSRLTDAERGVVRAEVIAAVAVNRELEQAITEDLQRRLGRDVEVAVRQDPSLIGGLVIRIGDRVLDNSLRTHLQQLQASLR